MLPDVRSDHLQIVKNILNKYIQGNEVYIFGSRANGKAKSTSDLDLLIKGKAPIPLGILAYIRYDFSESNLPYKGKAPIPLGILAYIRYDFSESNLPYKVDVIDWSVLSDNFRETIMQDNTIKININQYIA